MENSAFSEIFRYLRAVYRKRYLAICVSLVVMTGVIAYGYTLPEQYRAASTVFIEDNVISELVRGIAVTPRIEDRIRVLNQTMLSRELLLKVMSKMEPDGRITSDVALNAFVTQLQSKTNINFRERQGIFTVSIVDANPRFAMEYINTLVRTYVEDVISSKRDETYGASRFFDEQLVLVKARLDAAENAIIDFRRAQGIHAVADERTLMADINTYERSIEELNLSIDTQQARRAELLKQLQGVEPTISLFSQEQQENRLTALQQRLAVLLGTYTDNYPEVVRLRAEIEVLKSLPPEQERQTAGTTTAAVNPLYQELRRSVAEVESEIQALRSRRQMMENLKLQREIELQNIPESQKTLAVLAQERDSIRALYDQLLQRMGQSEVSRQMEISDKTTTFRIIDPAILPNTPISPNMVRMITMAIAAGIACGIGLVLLLDNFSNTIRDADQLKRLGVEVLAVIPHIDDPVQARRGKWRDIAVFSLAGLYFMGVIGLLGFEFLKQLGMM